MGGPVGAVAAMVAKLASIARRVGVVAAMGAMRDDSSASAFGGVTNIVGAIVRAIVRTGV